MKRAWPVFVFPFIALAGWIVVSFQYHEPITLQRITELAQHTPAKSLIGTYPKVDTNNVAALKQDLIEYALRAPITVVSAQRREVAILESFREMVVLPELKWISASSAVQGDSNTSFYQDLRDISLLIRALYYKTLPGRAYEESIRDGKIDHETIQDATIRSIVMLLDLAALMERYSAEWQFKEISDDDLKQMQSLMSGADAILAGRPAAALIRGSFHIFLYANEYYKRPFFTDTLDAVDRTDLLDESHAWWTSPLKKITEPMEPYAPDECHGLDTFAEQGSTRLISVFPGRFHLYEKKDTKDNLNLLLAFINNQLETFNWRFLPVAPPTGATPDSDEMQKRLFRTILDWPQPPSDTDARAQVEGLQRRLNAETFRDSCLVVLLESLIPCDQIAPRAELESWRSECVDRFQHAAILIETADVLVQENGDAVVPELSARIHTTIAETYCTFMVFKDLAVVDLKQPKERQLTLRDRINDRVKRMLKTLDHYPPDHRDLHYTYWRDSRMLAPYWGGTAKSDRIEILNAQFELANSSQ